MTLNQIKNFRKEYYHKTCVLDVCLVIFILFYLISSATALDLVIGNGNTLKTKILFGNISENHPQAKQDVDKILKVVARNLQQTNLFHIIQRKNIVAVDLTTSNDLSIEKVPDFVRYTDNEIEMLLVVDANFSQTGELEIKIRFWDVVDEKQLFGKFYASNKEHYKKMANIISDEIFKAATGEKNGHFDSKITYIAESGSTSKRTKRIAMIDFDGDNLQYLTNGQNLVLTPVFIKQKNEILFVRFVADKPQIYSLDLNNFLVKKVGRFKETTFAPTVNPSNNNIIAFSVINNGNSDIYQMDLFSNQTRRLTNYGGIATTPSYSPNGEYIAFSSDRSGNEKIYIMDIEGKKVKKITHEGGNYSKPVWSPDGKFLAFTKIIAGQFSIGIVDIDGKNEKTVTRGYLVEGAKWSPNGRYLLYSKQSGAYGKNSIPKLYVIDIITGFERRIDTPEREGATDPDWITNE